MTTHIAQCALEYWRASGPRTKERLLTLVYHFAQTNGETLYVESHEQSALAAVCEWELRS